MTKGLKVICILFTGVLSSCKSDDAVLTEVKTEENSEPLSKISTVNQDNSFVDAKGKVFFPWGYNYTNAKAVGFIEDNWEKESTWETITSDFAEMKTYAANIVRIHLQYNKFMVDAETPNTVALQRLKRLVQIAEDNRLYLDITGLAAYRKSDSPDWYDSLEDSERWATHAIFWKNIAIAVGDSEAVFAYNLMNEPVVAVGCDTSAECDWLPGEPFGGFNFIQNIARNPYISYDVGIKDWAAQLTEAIRQEDQTTMITIGFLGLGSVSRFAEDLDYLSIHTYPKSGEIQAAIDIITSSQSNKPLIIEETGNLQCSVAELETFLNQIDGNYNGLMGHYFGNTLEEMEAANTIVDALQKQMVEFIIANNPNR